MCLCLLQRGPGGRGLPQHLKPVGQLRERQGLGHQRRELDSEPFKHLTQAEQLVDILRRQLRDPHPTPG